MYNYTSLMYYGQSAEKLAERNCQGRLKGTGQELSKRLVPTYARKKVGDF